MARRKRKVEEQMDLLQEGGLRDEGGTVDPVSGNDVPPGSTQEEVRDDIPAQLSEGEFVFPADVVRYIGLENLMELRQKAKQGLGQMEAMGQMGNSDEATMSDTEPFEGDIDALIDEFDPDNPDTFEFYLGGVVPGQLTSSQTTPMYQAPATLPSFTSFVQQPALQAAQAVQPVVEQKEYIGPNGERITIQFVNGNPATPIPEGYKPFDPTAQPVTPEIAKPKVSQEDSSDDRERSAARKKQYADSLTEINTLSELSPEFKEWAEKNIPGQVKAAKSMVVDPITGEISFPGMSLAEQIKGIFSGEQFAQLSAGLTELGGTGPYGKAYADIAKNVGMDIDAYKKNGFLDKKSFLENVKNVMEDPNFEAKREARSEILFLVCLTPIKKHKLKKIKMKWKMQRAVESLIEAA
jgi:hypothetical protein